MTCEHQQHCLGQTQAGVPLDEFVWKGMQPVQHRVRLTTEGQGVPVLFKQADHAFEIGSKNRMMHRFEDQVMLLVPGTGATMQLGKQGGHGLGETAAQQVGKQMVVAVPPSHVVGCRKSTSSER